MAVSNDKFRRTVERVVWMLVEGQYGEMESQSVGDRLTAQDQALSPRPRRLGWLSVRQIMYAQTDPSSFA
jgi:hypothetical protein